MRRVLFAALTAALIFGAASAGPTAKAKIEVLFFIGGGFHGFQNMPLALKQHLEAKIQVLARRAKDGQPAAWVQNYGKGRVFYTGLGHGKEAWSNPGSQVLVTHGPYWAAGASIPEDLGAGRGSA